MAGILVLYGLLLTFFVGFAVGKLSERMAWNKLIEQKIIPTPEEARRYWSKP